MADEPLASDDETPEKIPLSFHLEYFEIRWGYENFVVNIGESVSLRQGNDFSIGSKWPARLTMAPATAKELARALTNAVARFETGYAPIWLPPEEVDDDGTDATKPAAEPVHDSPSSAGR
jgi:hypothetical protein